MIQRIQSIYLFLSVVAVGLLYFFTLWVSSNLNLTPIGVANSGFLMGLWLVMLVTQTISIFLYKNRKRQLMLVRGNIAINVVFIVAVLALAGMQESLSNFPHDHRPELVLPFISIIFLMLANKNIKKDDELIRSMNRLR